MKKIIAILSVAAIFAFVGCSKEKDYNTGYNKGKYCNCIGYVDGQAVPESAETIYIEEGDCEDMNESEEYRGYTVSVECTEAL